MRTRQEIAKELDTAELQRVRIEAEFQDARQRRAAGEGDPVELERAERELAQSVFDARADCLRLIQEMTPKVRLHVSLRHPASRGPLN